MHTTPVQLGYSHVKTCEEHAHHNCAGTIMRWQVRFMHTTPVQVQLCEDM